MILNYFQIHKCFADKKIGNKLENVTKNLLFIYCTVFHGSVSKIGLDYQHKKNILYTPHYVYLVSNYFKPQSFQMCKGFR